MSGESESYKRRMLLSGVPSSGDPVRRILQAFAGLLGVGVVGTVGYMVLGLGPVEAFYQTVFTVSTVGFTELFHRTTAAELFTIVLIFVGVGTVLYNLGVLAEALIEGHLREVLRRRRMDRTIARMSGHVIICGYGRVGRSALRHLLDTDHTAVVVDAEPTRLADLDELKVPYVHGDATVDDTLHAAGIGSARALIVALDTDADTMYATLSARALRPDMVIISRARTVDGKDKLVRAGATRAVNPQHIGGRRMASFALHADVAEFLDGVMHNDEVDHEFEQVKVPSASPFAGKRLADIEMFREMHVPVLALREPNHGQFITNPPRSTVIEAGATLILLASTEQIAMVHAAAGTTD